MAILKVKDADGVDRYIGGTGAGTSGDPFIYTHSTDTFVADETNLITAELLNGGSNAQNVDGSSTPVSFSYSPPAGFNFICARIIFYMESASAFNSNLFGSLAALTNGWEMSLNGVIAMGAKQNRELGSYLYDMQGVKIFGKEDKTMIGRFSFNKIVDGGDGVTIRDGESITTIVNDDLTGLTYLEARVEGVLKPV